MPRTDEWTGRIDLLLLVGVFVGIMLGFNIVMAFISNTPFHLFLFALFIFHTFEFVSTVYFRPYRSTVHDFLLLHSPHFMIAFTLCVVEYFVELYLFPSLKEHTVISVIFLTTAMFIAGRNFNHYIETEKRSDHVLVKHGIYAYLRHPSYFGWFWWSISTQCLALNPICTILYAGASWYFFKTRIEYEEETLIEIFGEEYKKYRKETTVGIPFI
ncbi:Protein-S-isoprenylcysteine O-methyltransferase [Entamoeba marina]